MQIPEELREQAIKEMEQSFGFKTGIADHFDGILQLAVQAHREFMNTLPDPTTPIPLPLASFRPLPEHRQKQLAATYARANANIQNNGEENRQFLLAAHRLRLGSLMALDGRISTDTADQLVACISTQASDT